MTTIVHRTRPRLTLGSVGKPVAAESANGRARAPEKEKAAVKLSKPHKREKNGLWPWPQDMPLDTHLCARIETALRGLPTDLAPPQLERRVATYVPSLAHLVKVVLSEVVIALPEVLRKPGVRQPSHLSRFLLTAALANAYTGLTGRPPSRSEKRGGFGAFVRDIFEAGHLRGNPERAIRAASEAAKLGG
jgi:hypothetical protein